VVRLIEVPDIFVRKACDNVNGFLTVEAGYSYPQEGRVGNAGLDGLSVMTAQKF
jgi:hypothetical protein